METEEGTPQGGPLSPLLSNIMLNDLDRELEERGHKFVRYADDCNIYVKTQTSRGTGDGKREAVSGEEVEVESEPEEEQSGTSDPGEIPGVQFLQTEGRSIYPYCEPDKGTLYGEDTEPDEANPLRETGRHRERDKPLLARVDSLLSTGSYAECV